MLDIGDDRTHFNFNSNAIRDMYARYSCVEKLLAHHPLRIAHLKDLSKVQPMHICSGITHLEDTTLHGSDCDCFVYFIKSADLFVEIKDCKLCSNVSTLYKYGKMFFWKFVSSTTVALQL